MNIAIAEIDVVANARRAFDRIDELARSMAELGQLQPVIVRREGRRYALLAGERRLRAARDLGWTAIAAEVVTLDALRAEMAALDSNLQSDALRGLDLDEALARRKQIYEALHPATRHGGGRAPAKAPERHESGEQVAIFATCSGPAPADLAQPELFAQSPSPRQAEPCERENQVAKMATCPASPAPRFTADAAGRMGVSERSVREAVQRAESLTPTAKEAYRAGTIDKTEATKVAALPPPKQDALMAKVQAASTPAEVRQVLKAEADAKRQEKDAKRLAALEANTPAPSPDLLNAIDLRQADVRDVARSLAHSPRGVGLVHADPPWSYRNEGVNGAAAGHYGTDSIAPIVAALNDAFDAAVDPCYLLMWATLPLLHEWFGASAALRWRYVTGGCWGKTGRPGSGFHWRGDAELLLVYAKGNPRPFGSGAMSNLFLSERTEHSEKPETWLRACVEHFGTPGLPVLDLWAGMAPMARACRTAGREYVGAELDPTRHREAMLRLARVAAEVRP